MFVFYFCFVLILDGKRQNVQCFSGISSYVCFKVAAIHVVYEDLGGLSDWEFCCLWVVQCSCCSEENGHQVSALRAGNYFVWQDLSSLWLSHNQLLLNFPENWKLWCIAVGDVNEDHFLWTVIYHTVPNYVTFRFDPSALSQAQLAIFSDVPSRIKPIWL